MAYTQILNHDTYSRQATPGSNYSGSWTLSCSHWEDKPAIPPTRRVFLKWHDLIPNIPDLENVVGFSISLNHLWVSNYSEEEYPASQVAAHQITSDWDETNITWNNEPEYEETSFHSFLFSGASDYPSPDWNNIEVTDLTCKCIVGDAYGMMLQHPPGTFNWDAGWFGNMPAQWCSSAYDGGSWRAARLTSKYLSDYNYDWSRTTADIAIPGYEVGLTATGRAKTNTVSTVSPWEINIDFKAPWDTEYTNITLTLDEVYTTTRTGVGWIEYFELTYNNLGYDTDSGQSYPIYYVHWWRDTEHRYVKQSGNDGNSGLAWDNAWKTYDHAMQNAPAGCILHVGFADYTAEPVPNVLSPVNENILVIYETEDIGGDTGTTTVEVN